jgi:DNA repair exonuclease SbcCD ATPase subunit
MEVVEMATAITDVFSDTFTALIERRESQFTDAIAPLHEERESLTREYSAIGEAAQSLAEVLPARARQAQFEADRLMLEGKHEEARAKLAESEEARQAPKGMKQRQAEITARIEAIDGEKKAVARRVFEGWYAELQRVIRAAEHGLFIELLDKSRDEMDAYQRKRELFATLDHPHSHFVQNRHINGLTADEKSAEWNSASRWYGGRTR